MNKESRLRILSFFFYMKENQKAPEDRENGLCCLAGISRQHRGPQNEEELKRAGPEETCNNLFPLVNNVPLTNSRFSRVRIHRTPVRNWQWPETTQPP